MKTSTEKKQRGQRLARAAYPLELSAQLTTRLHQELPVTILAMSEVDLRLAAEANPEHAEIVTVTIPALNGDAQCAVTGVVHWKEMRGAEHEVGIFLNQRLPRRLKQYCPANNRQSERYRCRIAGRLDWGSSRPDSVAAVVNYSINGFALQCAEPGEIDEVFQFSWRQSGAHRSVNGCALWQIEQNGGFLIGCKLENGGGLHIAGVGDMHPLIPN